MKLDHVIAERPHKKIYRDGDLVAKVFDESFPKSDVLNEALNQARVEETGLNIPKIEEVTKIDGKWAIISDYIEGKTLKELMDENPDKLDEYMNLFVDVQLKILSKKCPLLKRIKDKMQDKISQADLDATTRYELHTRLASMKKHNKVCHGDFNPSNVIITPDGTPYVLDWSHATQGNGAADVRRSWRRNISSSIALRATRRASMSTTGCRSWRRPSPSRATPRSASCFSAGRTCLIISKAAADFGRTTRPVSCKSRSFFCGGTADFGYTKTF